MAARTQLGVVTLIAVATLSVVWWLTTRADLPSVSAKPKSQEAPASQPSEDVAAPTNRRAVSPTTGTAADAFTTAFAALASASKGGDAAAAAASMRQLLRTDRAALAQAYEALLAGETEPDLRRAIAMVLGTLAVDGVDEVLLAALQQPDGRPTRRRTSRREPTFRGPPRCCAPRQVCARGWLSAKKWRRKHDLG